MLLYILFVVTSPPWPARPRGGVNRAHQVGGAVMGSTGTAGRLTLGEAYTTLRPASFGLLSSIYLVNHVYTAHTCPVSPCSFSRPNNKHNITLRKDVRKCATRVHTYSVRLLVRCRVYLVSKNTDPRKSYSHQLEPQNLTPLLHRVFLTIVSTSTR